MGQTASTEEEEAPQTGVSLAPELESDIVRDFQSQTLQEEWNKFGTSVVKRRNERLQMLQQAAQENQQKRSVTGMAQKQRLESIQNRLDDLNAEFSDSQTALQYDLHKQLQLHQKRFVVQELKDSKPLPCLGQRAHWIDCIKKHKLDSRTCNPYVEALEQCTKQTLGVSDIQ